jgi:hypothetical protein
MLLLGVLSVLVAFWVVDGLLLARAEKAHQAKRLRVLRAFNVIGSLSWGCLCRALSDLTTHCEIGPLLDGLQQDGYVEKVWYDGQPRWFLSSPARRLPELQ